MPTPARPTNPVSDEAMEELRAEVMAKINGLTPLARATHELHIEALQKHLVSTGYLTGVDTARKQAESAWAAIVTYYSERIA